MTVNASALISRQNCIDYIEIPSLTPAQGTLADLFINAVTADIQSFCERKFRLKAASAMGSYNPTGTPDDSVFEYPFGGRIFIPQYPVATIATLFLPYAAGGPADSSTVRRKDYWLDRANGVIELTYADRGRDPVWQDYRAMAPGYRTYRAAANYKGGYATIPPDLQLAAMEKWACRWRGRKRDGLLKSESLGKAGARFDYAPELGEPRWVREILESYRRLKV